MPSRVPSPMMATPAPALPVGDGWSYEVKWDGYRTLALKDGSRVCLYSRNLKDVTAVYPSVAWTLDELKAQSALLDGELVALDHEGRPSFQALHHQSAHTVIYYAFDLLQSAISRRTCPFVNLPSARTSHWGEGITADDMAALEWVKPAIVVEVAFTEWTRDGNLRHTSYVGVRDDKHARDVQKDL